MAWVEPLVATSTTTVAPVGDQPGTRRVVVRANGVAVLACTYIFDVNSKCSAFGVIMQIDKTGTNRQRMRAGVLMIRECIRSARVLGMTEYFAEAVPRVRAWAEAISYRMNDAGDRFQMSGKLNTLQAICAGRSQANGTLTVAVDEAAIIAEFNAA